MKFVLYMRLLLLMLSLFFFEGCKKEHCLDCFKGTGDVINEERVIEEFYKISLSDRINLYITQDSINKVVVEGGEHLLPFVVTEVKDGILNIRDDNRCNWVRSFKEDINVYLHCKSIYLIEYTGSGEVRGLNTIHSDTIELNYWGGSGCITLDVECNMVKVHQHTGCGDAELSGKTGKAYYYNRGTGQARCRNLITSAAEIDSKCTGDSYIYTNHSLAAGVRYIGNVYYAGQPDIIYSEVTERGRLIPLE